MITENISLLKYQKQAITTALFGKNVLMLLPLPGENCRSTTCCLLLSVETSPIGNEVCDSEFYWNAGQEVNTRLEI